MIPKINEITKSIMKLQEKQDEVMRLSRDVVRLSGETITTVHAKDYKKTLANLARLKKIFAKLKKSEGGFEYYSAQAHQEFVECFILYQIVAKHRIPSHEEIGEDPVNYLLGIMDIVGELKREAFEEFRVGNLSKAEVYYDTMKNIYDATMHMRFANSVMPGFRKKQDVARIQIESTGSELLRLAESTHTKL